MNAPREEGAVGGRIGVVSDLHANAPALHAALALFEREGIDALVVLGDLLSYGCRPVEVIEALRAARARWPTTFLVGNHDQLYFELQRGEHGYFDKIPAWIQESARWTLERLAAANVVLTDAFPWQDEHVVGDTLFSHANPFAARDWTYLNGDDARARAARALRARALRAGVFGHTHRVLDETRGDESDAVVRLLNPGSLGQPRDGALRATVSIWQDQPTSWRVADVAYDVEQHIADIERSSLSSATKREIVKFHRPAAQRTHGGEAS